MKRIGFAILFTALLLSGCRGNGESAGPTASPDAGVAAAASAKPSDAPADTAAASPAAAEEDGAEKLYQEMIAKFPGDFESCGNPPGLDRSANGCQKPDSLDTDLKENVNIQIILDSSGSMAQKAGSISKMEAAKRELESFVRTLPKTANVSLRVYGHVGSNDDKDKAASCAASEVVLPFQPMNAEAFSGAFQSFKPTGWTPIAASLERAKQDFTGYDGESNSNFIYLITDGVETCDGDPVAAAKVLKESNLKAVVNVVGFAVDRGAEQLRAVAQSGGGKFYEARNDAELRKVFQNNINWLQWTQYYNCVWLSETQRDNKAWLDTTNYANCIWLKSTQQANSIRLELAKRRNNGDEAAQKYGVEVGQWVDEEREKRTQEANRIKEEIQRESEERKNKAVDGAEKEKAGNLK